MAYYNLGEYGKTIELPLKSLAGTSGDTGIRRYPRAIHLSSGKLDPIW